MVRTKLNKMLDTLLIQGGMGVAVSGWPLARIVSMCGQLGVVSGTGLDLVFCRRAQIGEMEEDILRALAHFPFPEMGWRVWREYHGKKPERGFKLSPMPSHNPSRRAIELIIVATFVEVWLAKEGHDGLIGINFLEKLQTPHLYAVLGALLAGVDVIIVGAGLPKQFPRMLEQLMAFEVAEYELEVGGGEYTMRFDPASVMSKEEFLKLRIEKPLCLGIVSTFLAANILHKKSSRPFDGFIIELPIAGGHNAPPRDKVNRVYDMTGKDNPGIEDIRNLGLPFWLAGGFCSPEALQKALGLGARGVQIGTAFSLCRESGLPREWKRRRIRRILAGKDIVVTDHDASPTGYPFKVVQEPGTASEESVYKKRKRICDIGRLRSAHLIDGKMVWRCPSEPVKDYVRKGGKIEDTVGRKCICNTLLAAAGWAQTQKDGSVEPAIYTSGDDTSSVKRMPLDSDGDFGAKDVVDLVLGGKS